MPKQNNLIYDEKNIPLYTSGRGPLEIFWGGRELKSKKIGWP